MLGFECWKSEKLIIRRRTHLTRRDKRPVYETSARLCGPVLSENKVPETEEVAA